MMKDPAMFKDRLDAGQQLATAVKARLQDRPDWTDPVVLALPRGGLPVAFQVARALDAPLDLLLVRKVGLPLQPELAAGAVVDGNHPRLIINRDVLSAAGLQETDLEPVKTRELQEIERRRSLYQSARQPAPIRDRTVIVVDDGIATGATVQAALLALGDRAPKALILAVPVAPRDTLQALSSDVDAVICLAQPEPFGAVGAYYAEFPQLEDDDVIDYLRRAARFGSVSVDATGA
jgi:putative phosphoribosyl transferase